MSFRLSNLLISLMLFYAISAVANDTAGTGAEKFQQLDRLLPTPTDTRTASGAPGPGYWQQRVDYQINVKLDDELKLLEGSSKIAYHNNSPHNLKYLWLQLDQNRFQKDSDDRLTETAPNFQVFSYYGLAKLLQDQEFDGGYKITKVADGRGHPLQYQIVKTMMRVDLPAPLAPGQSFNLQLAWSNNIIEAMFDLRGGYEYFEEDDNCIYEIGFWYPRLVAYTDYEGWQHKQFLGTGEFTLEFGDYQVDIDVPADHVVAATGELSNAREVLNKTQQTRLAKAKTSDKPLFVITPEEAKKNQVTKSIKRKIWRFKADNVRDFAWASSRKFIWDAMGVKSGGRTVMAMSYYPNEAEPLWSQYSTRAVAHTIDVYSRFTFDYPYPVALSVNGGAYGMEYPMIAFNAQRPYDDGTYWDVYQKENKIPTALRSKYSLISVIVHEVGHNYFPMIVNSDERQWLWMDEGLNAFLELQAEQEWEEAYPSSRGKPQYIAEYMASGNLVPIMTNPESLLHFNNNAYGKTASALNILRESILGRELFDHAFREYAQRWKFKRPTPADFFHTMEDASGVDLDWFWRGWFYSTDHVDIELDKVTLNQLDTQNPDVEKEKLRQEKKVMVKTISQQRNKNVEKLLDRHPQLKDFYNDYNEFAVTPNDRSKYEAFLSSLEDKEKALLNVDKIFYVVTFKNLGGLVTPLPLRITYADDSVDELTIPAEIWRRDAVKVSKLFITEQEVRSIEFDPYLETADADVSNNRWPREPVKSRFRLLKPPETPNPMQRMIEDDGNEDDGEQEEGSKET